MPAEESPVVASPVNTVKPKPESTESTPSAQSKAPNAKPGNPKTPATSAPEGGKLSAAELKKRAKEEKAARRAAAVQNKAGAESGTPAAAVAGQKGEAVKGGKVQPKKGAEVRNLPAFKRVVESYKTPVGASLTRHFIPHVLSPQIEYLASCRPLSVSMGNAIRWLKLEISKIDPDLSEADAKESVCDAIDVFMRERVTFADKVIADTTAEKIRDGDVILTYAKSSLVQRAPLHEGKHLASALVSLGIEVKYCLIQGLSHNIQDVTKVLLGAHAMMTNGRLYSRIGTALVAMEASEADKPVIVLCETIKFSDRVALDSIVHNEIAPANELVIAGGPLENWMDVKKLQLCNPMYDVTPAELGNEAQ
ncbi:hypothetical protein DID88_001407 [Monilinia fructigena]|uniref:Translation initiation factor eIF2B subunit delta n=1 Tax=Monilinia fructigena TaxID=38457 RepID=A0A395IWZ1_9HELO|nr:hypothetical protein DID88_001407 [Monilinia fructigena]